MSPHPLRVAILLVDDRFDSGSNMPFFGPAPSALLEGFTLLGPDMVEAHIISCVKVEMPAPPQLAANVFYHQILLPHWTYLRTLHAGPAFCVRRILGEIRPDIVHSQGIERWCAVAGALGGFPAVLTIHGHLRLILQKSRMRPFLYWYMQMLLGEWAIRRHKGVICISSHIQKSLGGSARRTWLIPNAIRDSFIRTPVSRVTKDRSIPRILVVGTITDNKRPLELLQMFLNLHNRGSDFSVRFIGHLNEQDRYGSDFSAMMRKAECLGFAEHLHHMDSNALIQEMDNADALVHFPREEAFGLVVAEALSRDLRVFASRVGGIVDICRCVPGIVSIPANDFIELSQSIQQWLACGHERAVGAAAIVRQQYCPARIADETIRVYQQALQ
jgi:glycosyltransferase involved in cell wall biosynthesis